MEFKVGEDVVLRVSPTKGVIRFNFKGKHTPWYFRPFIKCYAWQREASLLSLVARVDGRCACCVQCLYIMEVLS
jgi:hypothetical protein